MKFKLSVLFSFCVFVSTAQTPAEQLVFLQKDLENIKQKETACLAQIEDIKLQLLRTDLQRFGLPATQPNEEIIHHSALSLVYSEQHEQAKWVAHIISPEIIKGSLFRSNDFRPDPKVRTGTAIEEDYFLKYPNPDGTFRYDGFGYDRGHLAPSADFRWSALAMSESYFYSNMSPQLGDFNREIWANVEGSLRGYLFRNPDTQLYVCTGGVLTNDLPKIERGVNKVSIPQQFYKVVIDKKNRRGIAFLMSNRKLNEPIQNYVVSIDEVEKLTGIDFFAGMPDDLENQAEAGGNVNDWFPSQVFGDVQPVPMNSLPPRHYNTIVAGKIMGKGTQVTVVGTVVSARRSRKGNILINLDRRFPNQIFTVFIRESDVLNFAYDPEKELAGKQIYVTGKVESLGSTATMYIKRGDSIVF